MQIHQECKLLVCSKISFLIRSQKAFDKKFSGGGDLAEFYKTSAERLTLYISALHDMWLKLYGSAIPTAAAITVKKEDTICVRAI